MKNHVLSDRDGVCTFVLVFEPGDEVIAELTAFARHHSLTASRFTGIGAFSDVTLGFFDLDDKDYLEIPVEEQVEVLSLVGNIARGPDGQPRAHAHAVVGTRDGTARGGHLLAGRVRPTLEVILTESPGRLQRELDAATGLPLIAL
ncbi:MAG TPA: PPC domain-containing DNA-binding protein [Thermoanaerobaculia bacterium]|nr:PPC domain-containing DNA-binding protein [Thermoanaerobaculia bacterium]